MAKRASEQRILQFRKDIRNLRRKYSNLELAQRLDMNDANLSSYYTGRSKNPGADFLDKFYKTFNKDMEEINNEENKPKGEEYLTESAETNTSKTEEAAVVYAKFNKEGDTGRQKNDYDWLQNNFDKLMDSHHLFAIATEAMATTNKKLVDDHFSTCKSENTPPPTPPPSSPSPTSTTPS